MPPRPTHALARLSACVPLALLMLPVADGAEFCVTPGSQLQAVLQVAETNGQHDVVRIAQGIHAPPIGSPFFFTGASELGGDDRDLSLIGGYVFSNGDSCGFLPEDASALDTLLDGENRERVLQIIAGAGADISIVGLGFIAGRPPDAGTTTGGGLRLLDWDEPGGTFLVERSLFIANQATRGAALAVSGGRVMRIVNNLVAGNVAGNEFAVTLLQSNQVGIYLLNNTIVNNTMDGGFSNTATAGVDLYVGGSSRAFVANNILWGNEYRDIFFAGPGFTTTRNNSIQSSIGGVDSSQGNVAIAPDFAGGLFDYNLAPGSALADIGLTPAPFIPFPPTFEENWTLPDEDLDGGPRITNRKVDIGAYETREPRLFKDGFE